MHLARRIKSGCITWLDRAQECTLILTEGDSAKALAVAGLAVLGRDKYGVLHSDSDAG